MSTLSRAVTAILATALAFGLVGVAAAVTLTSVAAAGPDAAKQRVSITMQGANPTNDVSPFVLTPLQAGPIKKDSGTNTVVWGPRRDVMREGQKVLIEAGVGTFEGKLGSLVTRHRAEWVDAGNGYNVAASTWKVVRGTGQYAGVTGGGRGGSVYLNRGPWSSRDEGFLTLP